MRFTFIISLMLFMIIILPGQVWCQVQEIKTVPTDPRLDTKLTLDELNITVQDLLDKVTKQTGVVHQVDIGKNAWSVRERQVHVIVKEMSLSSFQTALAKLTNYSWRKEGDPLICRYVMYQSEVNKEHEKKLLREKYQNEEQIIESSKQALERYRQIQSINPDELSTLEKTDPWAYATATCPLINSVYGMLDILPQGTLESVIRGGQFNSPYSKLSPEAKIGVQKLLEAGIWLNLKLNPNQPEKLTDELLNNVKFKLEPPDGSNDEALGTMYVETSNGQMVMTVINPFSSIAKPSGEFFNKLMASRTPEEAKILLNNIGPEVMDVLAPSQKYTTKPPKDPALLRIVEIKPQDSIKSAEDNLRLIAKMTDFQVLCDQYGLVFNSFINVVNSGNHTYPQVAGKQPVYMLLNTLAKFLNRTWVKEGDAILLTNPEWFIARTRDVPQEWVEYLKNRAKTGMVIDDLALIAGRFNSDQINQTLADYKELSGAAQLVRNNRSMLRFYYSLTTTQKNRAYSISGLSTNTLSQAQWQWAVQAFQSISLNPDINMVMDGAVIRVQYNPSTWTISLISLDGQTLNNKINIPKPVFMLR